MRVAEEDHETRIEQVLNANIYVFLHHEIWTITKRLIQNNKLMSLFIYIYIYIWSWVQVTPGVTLSNITLLNNLLLNSYFKKPTIGLHILYVFNMHAYFHTKRI